MLVKIFTVLSRKKILSLAVLQHGKSQFVPLAMLHRSYPWAQQKCFESKTLGSLFTNVGEENLFHGKYQK